MKSIKKLIIASALSMMAASCYAGSFLPNTVQEKSVDINFAAPEHLTVSLDQVPGLIAGDEPTGTAIAKLTVDSTSVKEFGARGGAGVIMDNAGIVWRIAGKNSGNSITVAYHLRMWPRVRAGKRGMGESGSPLIPMSHFILLR